MCLETVRAATVGELAARAVDGWLTHGIGGRPAGISVVKEPRRKSTVLRLEGAGPNGQAVIAKRCHAEVARIEQTVYKRLLPVLPVTSLRLYGVADDEGPAGEHGFVWLFIEDAGDVAWSPRVPEHRVLAAEWLGVAHLAAAELVDIVELPTRGSEYFRQHLRSATAVVGQSQRNDAVDAVGKQLLSRFLYDGLALEARWAEIEDLWDRFPRTLTLPGFGRKNACVRRGEGGLELCLFDFETAGWGVPAADVARLDLERYGSRVCAPWRVAQAELALLGAIGRALVAVKSIAGEARTLTSVWPDRAVQKLGYYSADLAAGLRALDAARGGRLRDG